MIVRQQTSRASGVNHCPALNINERLFSIMSDKLNTPGRRVGQIIHGQSHSRLHWVWITMRQRCNNPKCRRYPLYGGRGIRVCERWDSFVNFLADMLPTYMPGLSLDRKDNDGNYEPSHCKWSNQVEQTNNTRQNVTISHMGETLTVAQWARRVGLRYSTVHQRMRRGWTDPEQLFQPLLRKYK